MECKDDKLEAVTIMYIIRIVPEWNVKSDFEVDTGESHEIRIVPEWNVKMKSGWIRRKFRLLESYQSGM